MDADSYDAATSAAPVEIIGSTDEMYLGLKTVENNVIFSLAEDSKLGLLDKIKLATVTLLIAGIAPSSVDLRSEAVVTRQMPSTASTVSTPIDESRYRYLLQRIEELEKRQQMVITVAPEQRASLLPSVVPPPPAVTSQPEVTITTKPAPTVRTAPKRSEPPKQVVAKSPQPARRPPTGEVPDNYVYSPSSGTTPTAPPTTQRRTSPEDANLDKPHPDFRELTVRQVRCGRAKKGTPDVEKYCKAP